MTHFASSLKSSNGSLLLQPGRTAIMGILNVTPDSFSDGGLFVSVDVAIDHVASMLDDGADIIDVGGESTRPGAAVVDTEQELQRVIPIIEALADRFDTLISIDTSKATVMKAAVDAGAGFINDVRALTEDGALNVAAGLNVPVCLMHMQGQPDTMQQKPEYDDVVWNVRKYLDRRVNACLEAGIDISKLILDPGFGFGKTKEQNYTLLNELEQIRTHNLPILAGLSRKSLIGQELGLQVEDRLHASTALALLAVRNGASIVRVHDIKATVDAIRMTQAVEAQSLKH